MLPLPHLRRGRVIGREGNSQRSTVQGPVPHLQVDSLRVSARAPRDVRELDVVVVVAQTVASELAPAVFLLAHKGLAVRRHRESVARDGRGVGDVEGERGVVPLARDGHVRDGGRLRIQSDHVGELLGRRVRPAPRSFDGERVVAVRQFAARLIIAVEEGGAVEGAFGGGYLRKTPAANGATPGCARVGVGAHGVPGLVRVRVGQRIDITEQHRARGGVRPGVFFRRARDDVQVAVIRADRHGLFRIEWVDLAEGQAVEGHR